MLTFAAEGSSQGKLEINGHSEPVSYELIVAREEDDASQVRIRLNASRDWLLKQGFKGDAVLVRSNGSRIAVRRDGVLDVHSSVCVTLEGYDGTLRGVDEVSDAYPELKH